MGAQTAKIGSQEKGYQIAKFRFKKACKKSRLRSAPTTYNSAQLNWTTIMPLLNDATESSTAIKAVAVYMSFPRQHLARKAS
eukprot:scaffold662916_cov57-Prasinocladus_malaysianus.AAC.1